MFEPWLAVNLSMFFPGIGQLYAGKTLKGIAFAASQLALIAIAIWSIFSPTGNTITGLYCLLPISILYIASLFDAHASVFQQLNNPQLEKIPRIHKNPWFAVFLSRVLPGLGHFYLQKPILGAFFLSLLIIVSALKSFSSQLLIFSPIISAVSCYHAFISFPKRQKNRQYLKIFLIVSAVLAFQLFGSYLPQVIAQEVEIFEIPSKSMLPTLQVGDKIFVKKPSNYLPETGDFIVFKAPQAAKDLDSQADKNKEQFYIKRVIGKPGQAVRINNGIVYINNQPLQETYIAESPVYQWGTTVVPANSYFVLGDNRNNSFDSHVWGFVPKTKIVGQAYKIFLPPQRIQSLLNR
ncbi:MAG: signal peptidase I [Kastovskya adunca ATA6-11-RM4]|jgi:signal peptidase I|nr:signal peptidase I [Kastovskya adunca ATA6-11-RM4]